nr:MAG TPA: hypothetical protein [Caudoviricetes sp.]
MRLDLLWHPRHLRSRLGSRRPAGDQRPLDGQYAAGPGGSRLQ